MPIYLAVLPALIVTVVIGLSQYRWGSDLMTYGISPSRDLLFAGLSITPTQVAKRAVKNIVSLNRIAKLGPSA